MPGRRAHGTVPHQSQELDLIAYLCKRLAWAFLVLLGITGIVFVVVHLSGDPAALYMGPEGTKEDYQILRAALGFDRPLPEQYGLFLWRAAQGDFGRSLRHQQPTLPLVLARLPATLTLTAAAMVLTLVLPAVTLGVWAMARTARITRSSMLEVLHQDFLRTARAKGVGEWSVVLRHALRNCAIPIVTALGLELGNLLGGAVITEAVFAYPGIGRLAVEAVINKDVPLIQAVVLTVGAAILLLNILIDVVYVALDPRIRLA